MKRSIRVNLGAQPPVTGTRAKASSAPVNSHVVKVAEEFSKSLPTVLEPGIEGIRDFWLSSIVPIALSVHNGLEDSREVVEHALGDSSGLSALHTNYRSILSLAIRLKMSEHVSSVLNLSPENARILVYHQFAPKDVSLKELLESTSTPRTESPFTGRKRKSRPKPTESVAPVQPSKTAR